MLIYVLYGQRYNLDFEKGGHMPKVILWISIVPMMVFGAGSYAQDVSDLQDRSAIFDFCGLTRLLTKQEKVSIDKAEGRGVSFAVALCEKYTKIDAKDCVEKEPELEEVKANLKKKTRVEYGLAQALTDLTALSVRLGVDGGCSTRPEPVQSPDPLGKR